MSAVRTLVVCHYFPPEIGAPQARISEMARAWADAGDQVTVLTGMPNHPTGIVPPEYRGRLRAVEATGGHRVVRTWLYATPNEGVVRKTLGHLSFMVTAVALGLRPTGPADAVVVSSPTFFSILSAWVLAKAKRAALVVEIRDLWPAIFVELGVLTNPVAIRALEAVELWSYGQADEVVVVSEGFRDDLIRRGVDPAKITTIRNGVDLDRFAVTDEPDRGWRRRLGAGDDDVLVLYIGAHGISHGLTSVADAVAALERDDVRVAFVGEGAAKADLVARVAELGLTHVTLHDGVPRDDVPDILSAADIRPVPLRDVSLFSTFIPSKIFEYLGSGKAVIGSVRGEPAEILAEAGAVVVGPEDAPALAAAIDALAADPAARARMGAEGRTYVARHFDRTQLAERYRTVIGRAVEGHRRRRTAHRSRR